MTCNARILFCLFISILFFDCLSTLAQNKYLDSLYATLKTAKPDSERIKTLYKISSELSKKEPLQALEYAKQALTLSQKISFPEGQNICYNSLGNSFYQIGKFDSALYYYRKHYDLSINMADSMRVAAACDNLGSIYLKLGENELALQLRERANHIYEQLGEKSHLASGYTWIGNIYKETGDFPKALEYYLLSLKIYEELNDDKNLGYPLINISSIYRYQKLYS